MYQLQIYLADVLPLIFRQLSSIDRMLACGVSKGWKIELEIVSRQIAHEIGSDENYKILCCHKDYHALTLYADRLRLKTRSDELFDSCQYGCRSLVVRNLYDNLYINADDIDRGDLVSV